MRRICLAVAGIACFTAPPAHPTLAIGTPATVAPALVVQGAGTATPHSVLHAPGDDDLDPGGVWRCVRHPRTCLGDPLQPPPIAESGPRR